MKLNIFLVITLLTLISSCVTPEHSKNDNTLTKTPAMVVTANPHATKAGADVLRAGGSAIDAAIAIEAVLSLVEPQSSGLGGGGFMLFFDNKSNKITVYDGRETAPANVNPNQFLESNGETMGFLNAKNSGISIGVPGMISMLQIAHQDHGELLWGSHFDHAKKLAKNGFEVSPRLAGMIRRYGKYSPSTIEQGQTKAYHYFRNEDGEPLVAGDLLINEEYADALEQISNNPDSFYTGTLAEEIVAVANMHPRASSLTLDDMSQYQAKRREVICTPYREIELCGPPPPSSWLAVGMVMRLLERGPQFSDQGTNDPRNWSLFAEAQRLSYADRDQYVADIDFVDVPVNGLLHDEYLSNRAKLISKDAASDSVKHGDPWLFVNRQAQINGKDATLDTPGTTHFVVVDKRGDVVTVTATVESVFGSTRMAGGMFLNNELTDFSFRAVDQDGKAIANAVAPNKRPRSSMSPTIALDKNGEFLLATGSAGGNSIIAYTAKTLIGMLEWNLSPQEAIDLPNLVVRKNTANLEMARSDQALIDGLNNYGLPTKELGGEGSGLSIVIRHPNGILEGGVDSRREGVVEIVY